MGNDVVMKSNQTTTLDITGGTITRNVVLGSCGVVMNMSGGSIGGDVTITSAACSPYGTITMTGGSIAGSFDDRAEGMSDLRNVFVGGDLRSTNDATVVVTDSTIAGDVFVAMYSQITLVNVSVGGDSIISEFCDACSVTVVPEPALRRLNSIA